MARVELEIHGNYKQAINGANELTSSMDKLNNETKQYNSGVKNAMNKAVAGSGKLSGEFRTQKGLIEDLEDSIKDYEQKLRKATSTKDIEKYNRKIAEGKIHLADYKKKGVPAIKEVNKQASVGTGLFKKLGGAVAAAFSISLITRFMKESAQLYDKQVKAERKLLVALKGRTDIQKLLLKQASDLQKVTLFGDEQTIEAQAQLAKLLGANYNTISKLTPLVQDLATIYGMDLATASDLVGKSVGSSTNALSRYGIKIEGAVGSAERLESAVSELNRVVGGQSMEAAKVGTAAATQLANAWSDFREALGEKEMDVWNQVLRGMKVVLEDLTKAVKGNSQELINYYRFVSKGEREKEFNKLLTQQEDFIKKRNKAINDGNHAAVFTYQSYLNEISFRLDQLSEYGLIQTEQAEGNQKKSNLELKKLAEQGDEEAKEILEERKKIFEDYSKQVAENEEIQAALAGLPSPVLNLYENAFNEWVEFLEKRNDAVEEFALPEEADEALPFDTKKIKKEIEKLRKWQEELRKWQEEHPIAVMFGIDDPEKLEKFNTMADLAKDTINSLTESWVENSQRVVDALNTRISEQQRAVEIEAQLAAEGKANNLSVKKAELEDLKKQRDRALKEQEKALKAQQSIETASQTINIMTAVSNILKEYSKIPLVGLLLGGAAIAALLTLFKSTKGKVADLTKYAEGGLLEGRPHSQGGVKVPELRAELEGGEYVVNKKMTQKHLPLLEAINKDKIEIDKTLVHKFNIEKSKVEIKETPEIREIRDMMRKIMSRTEVTYEGGYRIERFGNVRRRIG